jgi:hypothetical protein
MMIHITKLGCKAHGKIGHTSPLIVNFSRIEWCLFILKQAYALSNYLSERFIYSLSICLIGIAHHFSIKPGRSFDVTLMESFKIESR